MKQRAPQAVSLRVAQSAPSAFAEFYRDEAQGVLVFCPTHL
jgi:hypothetical protein